MTKTAILKKFFKKFFDIDAHGWGMGSVLNDVIENNETLGGGGSSGGGGVMVVHSTYDESAEVNTLDKTWQEIHDAIQNGAACFIAGSFEGAVTMETVVTVAPPIPSTDTSYIVVVASYNDIASTIAPVSFYASTANDYPTN